VENFSFCPKQAFSLELKKHLYLSKENHLYMHLQHLAHYFPVRMEVVFDKKYLQQNGVFKVEKGSLRYMRSIQLICRNTRISTKKLPMLHPVVSSPLFHCESWNSVWKEYCLQNQSFQGGEKLILIEIGLFSCVEEIHVSLERKPLYWVAGACSTLLHCENWVSFWEEYFSAP
jgi:hypothetical protein